MFECSARVILALMSVGPVDSQPIFVNVRLEFQEVGMSHDKGHA